MGGIRAEEAATRWASRVLIASCKAGMEPETRRAWARARRAEELDRMGSSRGLLLGCWRAWWEKFQRERAWLFLTWGVS